MQASWKCSLVVISVSREVKVLKGVMVKEICKEIEQKIILGHIVFVQDKDGNSSKLNAFHLAVMVELELFNSMGW